MAPDVTAARDKWEWVPVSELLKGKQQTQTHDDGNDDIEGGAVGTVDGSGGWGIWKRRR